jgi:ferredoxin
VKSFGVVFPIHAWGVPEPVQAFLRSVYPELKADTYKFAVCTCGDDAGKAMVKLKTIFPYDSAWSVLMPNTYILMFSLDGEDSCVKKLRRARESADDISKKIKSCEKGIYDVREGGIPNLKSGLIHKGFVSHPYGPEKFTVNAGLCTGCGLCASNCPVGNIEMKDKLPVWGNRCINCLGCVHVCPAGASDCGGAAAKRGRYNIRYYLKRIAIAEKKPLNR